MIDDPRSTLRAMAVQAMFSVGDEVFYVLPRSFSHNRPHTLYLRAVVLNITEGRVVIRPVSSKAHRITKATSLVTQPPAGAWVQ